MYQLCIKFEVPIASVKFRKGVNYNRRQQFSEFLENVSMSKCVHF